MPQSGDWCESSQSRFSTDEHCRKHRGECQKYPLAFETVKAQFREVWHGVKSQGRDGWNVVAMEINWEDAELYDDHTSERIESAYAEPEGA